MKKNAVRDIASGIDRLCPILPRSPILIKHGPSHLHKSAILPLYNTILLWCIGRRILVVQTLVTAKGIKTSIPKFCFIVTPYSPHGMQKLILQPQDQVMDKLESLILGSQEKDLRIARKVIHDHKNVLLPTNRHHPRRTYDVHMEKFSRVRGHHLIDGWM